MPSIPTSEPTDAGLLRAPTRGTPTTLLGLGAYKALRAVAWGMLMLASMATALWLVLQWGILPRIEAWRPALEHRAGAALGVPVRIGAIQVIDSGLGWAGALELQQVVLLDPRSGREALRLPRVRATLSTSSLLPGWDGAWRIRFRQLLVDAPELEIRRDAAGQLSVAGLQVGGSAEGGAALADWFFSQPEFAILGGRVRWTDELRAAPPLELTAVDFVVRSGVRRHALRLDATPPPEWGERFSLRGEFAQPLLNALPSPQPAARAASGVLGPVPPVLPAAPAGWLARPGDWRRWRGTVYAELPTIDLAPLHRHVTLPLEPTQGRGTLRAWVDVRDGQATGLTADLRLRDLALRLDPAHGTLALARVEGRLALRREAPPAATPGGAPPASRWSAELRQLAFATADGLDWPASDARLAWQVDDSGRLVGGELSAAVLDLGRLSQTLARLPTGWVGTELQARLVDWAPRGEARQVEAQWSGPLDAPSRYRLKARLQGLTLAAGSPAPQLGRPGLRGGDLELSATELGGEAKLSLRDGELEFPGVFEQPRIGFDRLDTQLSWRLTPDAAGGPPQIELRAGDLQFANADTQGRFDLRWVRPAGAGPDAPGVIDLTGRLGRTEVLRVPRYLPLVVGPGLRDYLRRSLQGGHAGGATVRLAGDLARFPFRKPPGGRSPSGEFRVVVPLEDVRFAFLPGAPASAGGADAAAGGGWPAINDIRGELVFEHESMQLRKLAGRLASAGGGPLELRGVEGRIADLEAADPVLAIEGGVRGPLPAALRFLQVTPVGGWLGDALAQASAAGGPQAPIDLKLGLAVPLDDGARTRVRGTLQLAGNDLRLRPDLPLLGAVRARVAFTESSFSLSQGTARLLGGDVQFEGGLPSEGGLRLNLQGTASAEGLRRSPELGGLARAAALLSGQTSYRLSLGVVRGQPEWQFNSNLAGLAVDLPAPLGKRAEATLPLRVQAGPPPLPAGPPTSRSGRGESEREPPPRDLLRVELGPEGARLLQAQYLRELLPAGPRVLQGAIALGPGSEALPAMTETVAARLNVAQLDLGAWERALQRLAAAPPGGAVTAPASPASPLSVPSPLPSPPTPPVAMTTQPSIDGGYLPGTLQLRAQSLQAGGHRLSRVEASVSRAGTAAGSPWKLEIDAAELAGRAEYRPPGARAGEAGGSVQARLSRLSIPRGEETAVSSLLDQAPASSVPALDIVVDEFELRGKRLGRLEIEAENRAAPGAGGYAAAADGPAGEWQLRRFRLLTPEAQLNATGRWAAAARAGQPRRVAFDFTLDVSDGGALLARLGEAELLRGAKGRITGQIDWLGSPLSIDHPSLGGRMNLDFDRGQFLQAEPGIAKLLGVLNLQALPRRLALDFRDVFSQGFAFDALGGDIELARGVAQTRNLRLRGVQAVVFMQGSADVARETQDLRVWIVPELNAGTASLAYAAINPAVGIGAFLAQFFLRRPLADASTREFHITGPWAAPQVERVERAEPRPAEMPASGAGAAGGGSATTP